MAGKRKKPRSLRKRLALLCLLIAGMLGVVLFAKLFSRAPVYLFPEVRQARTEERTTPPPERGILYSASALLPARPEAKFKIPQAWWNGRHDYRNGELPLGTDPFSRWEPNFARLEPPDLKHLCWWQAAQDDAVILDFVLGSEAAAQKAHEAIEGSAFRLHMGSPYFGRAMVQDTALLCRTMVALGRVKFEKKRDFDSLTPLLDAIRIARKLSNATDNLGMSQSIEGPALQQIRHLACTTGEIALLRDALRTLGPGFEDRRRMMEVVWMDLDDDVALDGTQFDTTSSMNVLERLIYVDTAELVTIIQAHRDEVMALANEPPRLLKAWLMHNARKPWDDEMPSFVVRAIALAMQRAAEINADYHATEIALALEAWKQKNGAYPNRLDVLVPEELNKLPMDAATGEPFAYTLTDGGYMLYSYGVDGLDNGGGEADRVIVTPNLL